MGGGGRKDQPDGKRAYTDHSLRPLRSKGAILLEFPAPDEAILRKRGFCSPPAGPPTCLPAGPPEIAFAGRSNVGKSSAINALLGRKGLARTSKTPGRTQTINFYELAGGARLVDLPGYGYARVPQADARAVEGAGRRVPRFARIRPRW